MNDRSKEFIKLVGTDVSGKWMSIDNTEKFAELIVRECSLFVFKQNGPKSALNLLEHFGVEE